MAYVQQIGPKKRLFAQRRIISTDIKLGALEEPGVYTPCFPGVAWGSAWGGMMTDKSPEIYLRRKEPICMAESHISGR